MLDGVSKVELDVFVDILEGDEDDRGDELFDARVDNFEFDFLGPLTDAESPCGAISFESDSFSFII